MTVTDCKLIGDLILAHTFFKVADHEVVRSIVAEYYVDDEPGLINDYLRQQTEQEARIVFLTGKYSAILMRLEHALEELEAELSIELGDTTESGYKRTRKNLKESLFCNDKYLVLREQILEFKILTSWLERLSMIVFRRQGKLEPLAVNYRRETEADKRHGFE